MCKEETTTKNLLIIPMSSFSSKLENGIFIKAFSKTIYHCPKDSGLESIETTGYQQEPVPLFLNEYLDGGLDRILAINTEDTEENEYSVQIDNKDEAYQGTAFNYFKSKMPKEIKVDSYHIENPDLATQKDIDCIMDDIKNYARIHDNNIRIFLDIHGGPRSNIEIMTDLFSLLPLEKIADENQSETTLHIRPEDVYSTIYNHKDNPIYIAKEGFELLNLVTGVHEFVEYGKAETLLNYSKNHEKIQEIVNSMKMISDGLSMGHVSTFEKGLNNLNTNLNALEKNESENETTEILTRLVRQEYDSILNDADITKVILWNNNKQFFQFAMTLCESKMLGYAEGKDILNFDAMTVAERKNINKAEKQLKELNETPSITEEQLKKGMDVAFNAKNQYDMKLNGFIRNFKKVDINNLDILYYVPANEGIMYFFCSKANEISEKLELFLNEHKRIKETRNNSNHAGDNNANAYQNVTDLQEAIKNYISYFNVLSEHKVHYKLCGLNIKKDYTSFCKENESDLIDEDTYKQLAIITKNLSKTKGKKPVKNPKIELNLGIDFETMDNASIDYDNQISRIKCYLNNYKELNSNNKVILYYKPNTAKKEIFKNADDYNKCFFLCFKKEHLNEVKNIIDRSRKLLDLEKNELESAMSEVSKETEFKIYCTSVSLSYKKFCERFNENIIDEETYLLLRHTAFPKVNTNKKSKNKKKKNQKNAIRSSSQ